TDTGHSGRPGAVRAGVADRRDDHHAGVHEGVGGRGGRVGRPVHEGGADAHVQHIHVVREGSLHGGEHDVGGGRSGAAEDAVGAQAHVRRHPGDLTGGADDAGHVGAVPLAVVRVTVRLDLRAVCRVAGVGVEGVAHEVVTGHDPVRREAGAPVRAVAAAVGVVVVAAGVTHRG